MTSEQQTAPTPSASEDRAGEIVCYIQAGIPEALREHKGNTATVCSPLLKKPFGDPIPLVRASALSARDETIARLTALCDRLKMEAQGHRMEARGANDSLHKSYQACTGGKGEPGNWNGAEPVKRTVEELRSTVSALEARLAVMGEALKAAHRRCRNDMGYDMEHGPIGCTMGDGCACVGEYITLLYDRAALEQEGRAG